MKLAMSIQDTLAEDRARTAMFGRTRRDTAVGCISSLSLPGTACVVLLPVLRCAIGNSTGRDVVNCACPLDWNEPGASGSFAVEERRRTYGLCKAAVNLRRTYFFSARCTPRSSDQSGLYREPTERCRSCAELNMHHVMMQRSASSTDATRVHGHGITLLIVHSNTVLHALDCSDQLALAGKTSGHGRCCMHTQYRPDIRLRNRGLPARRRDTQASADECCHGRKQVYTYKNYFARVREFYVQVRLLASLPTLYASHK